MSNLPPGSARSTTLNLYSSTQKEPLVDSNRFPQDLALPRAARLLEGRLNRLRQGIVPGILLPEHRLEPPPRRCTRLEPLASPWAVTACSWTSYSSVSHSYAAAASTAILMALSLEGGPTRRSLRSAPRSVDDRDSPRSCFVTAPTSDSKSR